MAIDREEIEKIATLARIKLDEQQIPQVTQSISDILALVDQMQSVDTDGVTAMANPLDATQRLRPDEVTERDERDAFQGIAPNAESGLYLVPKVIE